MIKSTHFLSLFTAILLTALSTSYAQTCQVRGWVKAADGGEPLIGATVYSPDAGQGVYVNPDGYFLLRIPCGGGMVVVQQLGYVADTLHLPAGIRDTFVTVRLQPLMLETVTVTTQRVVDLPGKISIPVEKLKAMPALLGETDIFRSLQRMPGISNAVEGTTGLVVRGGAIDQNLILLDGNTLYNNGHVFGFISAVNPAVVKHVDVYTGYIPAQYAGRLSSVVDIHTKDGDKAKRKREVSLGSINSSWTLEGPMGQSGRNSYLLSTRVAHSGILTLATLPRYARGDALLFAGMYDVNAKLSWEGDRANKLSLSLYAGDDFWGATSKSQSEVSTSVLTWGNKAVSLRYVRPNGRNVWATTLLGYNRYGNQLKGIGIVREADLPASRSVFASQGRIDEYRLHHAYKWAFRARHTLTVGAEAVRQVFLPTSVQIQVDGEDVLRLRPVTGTWTGGAFVTHALPLGRALTLHTDLRFSAYVSRSLYLPWLEPRLSVDYQLADNRWIFAAYSRTRQPLHLVTFNGNAYPYDYWLPATQAQWPEAARIFSAGYKEQRGIWAFSVEAFYKPMKGLVALRTNRSLTEILGSGNWSRFLLNNGRGKAYGVEVLLEKTVGRANGFVAYTWSRSWRRFEAINGGDWTPFVYDRPHDLEAVLNYKLNNQWSFHTGFTYQRGQPMTSPTAYIRRMDGSSEPVYTRLLNDRLPDIHRLDIMVEHEYRTLGKRPKSAKLSFGVYNAYGRANPVGVAFREVSAGAAGADVPQFHYATYQTLFRFVPIFNYTINW